MSLLIVSKKIILPNCLKLMHSFHDPAAAQMLQTLELTTLYYYHKLSYKYITQEQRRYL